LRAYSPLPEGPIRAVFINIRKPMSITAKFHCHNVDLQPGNPPQESVSLGAVTDDTPENKTWSDATPSGHLDLLITNPAAQGFFKRGEEYFLEIRHAGGDAPPTPPPAEEPADVTA
jgi:hypothetical protein